MNRLLYRIVFNRARGMLMVVAEIARSCTGSGVSSGIGHTHSRLIGKVSALSFSLWLATGSVQTVQANIVADKSAPGNQRPTVLTTANGIPQVNIQTPSAAGVSRNTYSQFDVNQKGAILNNSRKNTATQTGGMVSANPWLAKGEAKIILNEVNARDPSRLNGYIEVAGQKAQVVIASPSGITCNGCGFINAGRVTLTTGQAQMQNGSITGYQVERGEILVEGKGLDSSLQDHTDIIARAVKANAAIHASDLKVTAGRNRVDAAHEQTTALADNGSPKPQLAVDVSQVGGMYAGKIRLLGTEKGVGVRNAGHIGAEAGLVTVTADGRIVNSGELTSRDALQVSSATGVTNSGSMQSQKALNVASAGDIHNSGSLWSSEDATVQAATSVNNSGAIAARNHVTISGSQIVSTQTGTLAAGVQPDGKTASSGNLTLTASGKLEMNGLNVAGGNLQASGQGLDASGSQTRAKNIALDAGKHSLSTSGAQVIAGNTLKATTAGTLDNNSGQLAADKLLLTAKRLQNNQGQIVQSGTESLTLNHQDGIENREGSIATNAHDLTLQAEPLDNRDGEIIHAGEGALTIASATFIGDRGNIDSSGLLALKGRDLVLDDGHTAAKQIRIEADSLSNRNGQLIQSGQETMALDVRQKMDNRDGLVAASGKVQLNTAHFDNRKGQIQAVGAGSLMVSASEQADNREGILAAADNLTLSSGKLTNDNGLILAEKGSARLTTTEQLSNEGGEIAAANALAITAGGLDNHKGRLVGDNLSLSLNNQNLNNQTGTLAARSALAIGSGELNNDTGLIQSGGSLAIDTNGQALYNRDTQTSGGIVSTGELEVVSASLANQNGFLAGAGNTRVQATAVDNRDGVLASESSLSLVAQSVDNRDGALSAAQDLALALAGALNNREGVVSAGESLNIGAAQLDNSQGVVVAGGDAALSVAQTDNQKGQLAAQGDLALMGEKLDNDNGGLVQSGGHLALTVDDIRNRDSGQKGGITSKGNMAITSATLLNDRGLLLSGKQAVLDATRLSNISGTLAALEALKLTTHSDTDNRKGVIQGAGIVLDTTGNLLDNRDGTINSLAAMQLATQGLNNQNGTLGAKGDFTLKASWLDNSQGGRMVGEKDTAMTLANLDNRNGQIQSVGNLLVNALAGAIDNSLGLIRSGASATLNTASLINRDTQSAEKGIEGLNVAINSRELDNHSGTLLAGNHLGITNTGALNNSRGELASGGRLSVEGTSLNLNNAAGVVKAQQRVSIQAERLSGDGQLLTPGDMSLNIRQDLDNSGEMIANGNFTLTTPGRVTNSGKLLSGAKLDITSGNLLNTASGEIAAGYTWLTVANTLTNYGLIDGNWTLLKAGTLTNIGTGRIYGDNLGIQAGILNNLAQNGTAATLAGRERVDIGASTINNRDHALIYSNGYLAVGGKLDANGAATGQAGVLNNHSATIESGGNMSLSVRQLNNINDHFSTEVVQISSEQIHEYQHNGSPNRWDASVEGVFVDNNSSDHLKNLNTPDRTGHNNDNFYEYKYTRTIEEEVISESDPGKILSGGHMSISASNVLNDKSQIVAGGTLGVTASTVDNVMPEGSRWITDVGSVTHYYRKKNKGSDSQRSPTDDYVPPTVIQSITLRPGALEGNTTANGSGFQLAAATQQGTDTTISNTGRISTGVAGRDLGVEDQTVSGAVLPVLSVDETAQRQPGQLEVPASGDPATVIRVTGPDTRLPDNSLFKTHPEPGAHYLVETDPRFTNNKQWLGSDYMQKAFATNHDNMHKRLGDGFYEQRLVREQIIALTGGRYLGDYRDDETQFKALMDAGIAFGQKYHLIPGVALTAEQMSLLTDDMVWLVNTQVQLADGSWQTVMVPQVYARVKPGDIDGSGALLGGQNVVMDLNSDLLNSGTISGREVVQLSAENITNRAGTIQGADISLQARTDINNIGGLIAGNNSVLANAGRDINLVTTTRSAQSTSGNNAFERTTIERVAGIYVQGEDGKLSLSAGRDIALTGAQVVNSGQGSQTVLNAGRDLNLNTVTTSASDHIVWDKNNWLKQSGEQHTGSEISGEGSIVMLAGRDVNAQAASVSADDSLGVAAGRDINLTAATDRNEFESKHKYTGSSGVLSKTTTTTHDVVNSETAQGTLFSGDSVVMQAGHDLGITGSAIAADGDIVLKAGNDVTVQAATEQASWYSMHKTKKSGVMGSGLNFTVGSQSSKLERDGKQVTESDARSVIGTSGGNIIVDAGNKVTLSATDMVAGRAEGDTERKTGHIDISASDIAILPGRDVVQESVKQSTKSSGLSVSVKGLLMVDGLRNLNDIMKSDTKGVSRAKQLGSELGATGMDVVMGMPSVSYGRSSSKSESHYQGEYSSGSHLSAAGNIQLTARGDKGPGDLVISGSTLNASESAILDARRDVTITTSTDREQSHSRSESSSLAINVSSSAGSLMRATEGGPNNGGGSALPFGKGESNSKASTSLITQTGSKISGSDIYINSREGNIVVSGSALTSINDLMLGAKQGNIDISAASSQGHSEQKGSNTTLGSLGGDGYSAMAGWSKESYSSTTDSETQSDLRSQLVSGTGNVVLEAGRDVIVRGSDIAADKSLLLSGENVLLETAADREQSHSKTASTQYGVEVSTSGWAVSAAQGLEKTARTVEEGGDSRLAAVRAAQTGLDIATQTVQSDMSPSLIKVKVSAVAGSSEQSRDYSSVQQTGSTLTAGESVVVKAKQDITGEGVNITGKQVTLDAGRDITLSAAQSSDTLKSQSSGSRVGVGIGFSAGGSQNGFTGELAASQSSGREKGSGLTHSNSHIWAQENLTVSSGRDTTLEGAQLSGGKVTMNVGGDLSIASVQDRAEYDSKQSSSGANLSVCIPPFCFGTVVQGSGNYSTENLKNDYHSVTEQSGITAGSGGFDITVGHHTQLDGAVIASTATPDKNRLDTGTLGWRDIENESTWSGTAGGISLSTSAAAVTTPGQLKGDDSGMTHSAISNGTLTVRDTENQQQDISTLSRDTENAHNGVNNGFDADKVKDSLAVQKEATALGVQAVNAYQDSQKEKAKEEARQNLEASGALKGLSAEAANAVLKAAYDEVEKEYGIGSDTWTAGMAATGLLAGVLGGNVQGGIAAGAAPYLASLIKDATEDNEPARIALHGIVSAALMKAQGGSPVGAAAGGLIAAGGADGLALAIFGKSSASELDDNEKVIISNLVTAIGAVAGAAAGGDGMAAMSGANAARVEVENNSLALVARGCAVAAPCRIKVAEQLLEIGAKAGIAGLAGAAIKDVADKMTSDELEHLARLEMMGNDEITGKYLSSLQDKYAPSHTGNNDGQVNTGPNHTGNNNSQTNTGPNHTGNNDGQINTGPNNTGGDQSVEQLPSNTGNNEGAPDLPNYMENQGYDPRLPIPEATTASNGLKVESNTKHTPGAQGFRPNAGIEPKNSLELFEKSVSIDGNKARYSIGLDGSIHRYFPDNMGTYHWSGSTGDSKNPMQLDNKTKAQLRKQEGWKIK